MCWQERHCEAFHLKVEYILADTYFDLTLAWQCTTRKPWELDIVRETRTLITAQLALQPEIFVPSINAYND